MLAGMTPVFRRLQVLLWTGLTAFSMTGWAQTPKPVLYYIPHTHWEGAVFKTREEDLDMGLVHILKAIQLLKQYPEYKFTLDQVACLGCCSLAPVLLVDDRTAGKLTPSSARASLEAVGQKEPV